MLTFVYLLSWPLCIQVIQLRKACSHPYLFPGIEPEPYEEGEHLVQVAPFSHSVAQGKEVPMKLFDVGILA